MSDIFIMIRNQHNRALATIDNLPFITVLQRNGEVIAEEPVDPHYGDAGFDDLPIGKYTVIVRHKWIESQEATYNVTVATEEQVALLTFVYREPERVLLRILAAVEERL
jgi:hypothetical protein